MIADAPLLINSSQLIQLKSGATLTAIMMMHNDTDLEDTYNDTISGELSSFSIILLNVTSETNGLSVKCGVRWEEKNITLHYRHTAVVAVTTQKKRK